MQTTGFELLLPAGVLDYFEVSSIEHTDPSIYI